MSSSYTPLHTHLSSIHLPPFVLPVPTSQTTSSSSSDELDHHPSHALHSFSDLSTGLLARVINNGFTLELSSIALSSSKSSTSSSSPSVVFLPRPLRFIFPSKLLPTPTIFTSPATSYIHIVALSESGHLYRLSFPLAAAQAAAAGAGAGGGGGRRSTTSWESILDKGDWSDEYEVAGLASGRTPMVFHAADEQTVLVGLGDGAMIRLDRDQGSWTETDLKPSSYLSSFTSLLPSFSSSASSSRVASPATSRRPHSSASTPSEIVSLSSHLQEDTLGLAFSLSRDRKLRVWNLVTGACVRTVEVPSFSSSSSALIVRGHGSSASTGGSDLLLPTAEDGPSSFIRVISRKESEDYDMQQGSSSSPFAYHLAIFIPSGSSSHGGRFVFYGIQVDDTSRAQVGEVVFVGEKLTSIGTGGAELRDFDILPSSSGPSAIWAVWDVRGETMIQRSTVGSIVDDEDEGFEDVGGEDEEGDGWETLSSPSTPAFNATYFEEIIRSTPNEIPTNDPKMASNEIRRTVSELFVDHLFYPSRFSPTSLHQALDSYISNLLSTLPSAHPSSLSISYPSLSLRIAAIVASHVQVETSSQTGEYLYAEFGKKVLIEWLGFLARVEESERDARWSIGFVRSVGRGGEESVVVVQRDGLVLPGTKWEVKVVASQKPSVVNLSSLALSISSALNPSSMLELESDLSTLTSSPLPFAVDDVALEIFASRVESFVSEELATALRTGLNTFGTDFEKVVDVVRNQVVSLDASSSQEGGGDLLSDVGIALVAAGVRNSVELRYRLARDLLLLLIFALNEVDDESPAFASLTGLVGKALTVYHSLSVLRWISTVSPTDAEISRRGGKQGVPDESSFLERFDSSLKMSTAIEGPSSSSHLIPPPTLLQALLATSYSPLVLLSYGSPSSSIPSAATAFLSTTSLSNPGSLVAAQPQDVVLAERLLIGGHVEFAYEFAGRWPEEEGMGYVQARAALGLGKVEESEEGFERIGAALAFPSSTSPNLNLLAVLPTDLHPSSSSSPTINLVNYYRHVSLFYEPLSIHESIVRFCNLAIEAAGFPSDATTTPPKTKDLWSRLFKSTVALGRYEDAYMILTTTPHRETTNDAISHLITAMCHAGEVDRLTQFTFVGFQDVVERTLAFKARHSDPMAFPNYLLVLYAWHVRRGDYRNAASAMYQQGRRFGEVNGLFTDIGPRRAKSYLLAINALSLVDKKHAWLAVPIASDGSSKTRKRRKLTSHIPEEKFSKASRAKDVEIVELEDIRRDYNLVLSTLVLAEKFPDSFQSNVLSAEDSVALFVQAGMFDQAILTARQLQVDMTGIFERLAIKAVDAAQSAAQARSMGMSESYDELDWLLSSPIVSSLDGPIAGRATQYLKIMLERHDGPETFYRYRAAVLEKLLESDRRLPLPIWLVEFFATNDPEHLVQACLKYDLFEEAVKHSLDLVRKAPATDVLAPKQSGVTYLPYNLLDVVLKVVRVSENEKAKGLAATLDRVVEKRIAGLQGLARR